MAVNPGDVLRISTRMRHGSTGDVVNVWYAKLVAAAAVAETTLSAAVNDWMTIIYQEFDQLIAQGQDPLDMKIDVVEYIAGKWTVTNNVFFGSWGALVNTAETSDLLPSGSAVLGKLRTALGKHWGRKWLGIFTEVSNLVGFVTTGLQTAAAAGLGQFLLGHTISGADVLLPVVLNVANGNIQDVLEVAVNSAWSYQRRRRTGVGS